jgi:hypothetical protein
VYVFGAGSAAGRLSKWPMHRYQSFHFGKPDAAGRVAAGVTICELVQYSAAHLAADHSAFRN